MKTFLVMAFVIAFSSSALAEVWTIGYAPAKKEQSPVVKMVSLAGTTKMLAEPIKVQRVEVVCAQGVCRVVPVQRANCSGRVLRANRWFPGRRMAANREARRTARLRSCN